MSPGLPAEGADEVPQQSPQPPPELNPWTVALFLALVGVAAYWIFIIRPRLARALVQEALDAEALRRKRMKMLGESARKPAARDVPPRKCSPIQSVQALLDWTEASAPVDAPVAKAKRSLAGEESSLPNNRPPRRRIFACHDMAGNYAVDAWVDGWYPKSADEAVDWQYAFRPTTFAMMDVFCYFSHNLVSIPPRGWIDAAHRHGCSVYGTLMTEWDQGSEDCQAMFSSADTAAKIAAQLERIRAAHGFDGWLVNIENKVENVNVILGFLELLQSKGPVVFYDSITREGQLQWQNGLTDLNRCYFDKSSGFFTNYGWNAERIQQTCATAGDRAGDVWHGIDVFGRQTMGGGGLAVNVPLQVLSDNHCTASALFAIGWTLEEGAHRDAALARKSQDDFWRVVGNAGWGNVGQELLVTRPPFFTDFCDGGGRFGYFSEGRRLSSAPWMDLRRQTHQPDWDSLVADPVNDAVVCRYRDTGAIFAGGGCLQIVGRSTGSRPPSLKLLSLDMRLGGGPHSMLSISAALLPTHGEITLFVDIEQRNPGEPPSRLLLVGWDDFPRSRDSLKCRGPDDVVAGGWRRRRFVLKTGALRGRRLLGLGVQPSRSGFVDVRLGQLSLNESEGEGPQGSIVHAKAGNNCLSWECSLHGAQPCGCWHRVHVYSGDEFVACGFGKQCSLIRAGLPLPRLRKVGWEGVEVGNAVSVEEEEETDASRL